MTRTGCLTLTIRTDRRGSVRFLSVGGDLSAVSAAGFTDAVRQAAEDRAARVVVDLSGVRSVDAAGARALAAAASPVPGWCQVVLRSLRPALQQFVTAVSADLDLARSGLAMVHEDAAAGIDPRSLTWMLKQESGRARSAADQVMTDTRRAAQLLAVTEDKIAVTLASLAVRRPGRYDRMIALSLLARERAARLRDLTGTPAVRQASQLAGWPVDRHSSSLGTVQRAIAFIDEHARDDISAADIAAAVHVTPRAVQLAFRRHLDITPMAYLRQVRLEQAHRELLSAGPDDRTVTRIAADWGFTNSSRFTARYQETYGVLPSRTLHRSAAAQPD